jgi:hypothetical protein
MFFKQPIMKRIIYTLALVLITKTIFAQVTGSSSTSEAYRNFMVQSSSAIKIKDLVIFDLVGGSDRFFSNEWLTGGGTNYYNVTTSANYWFNYDFLKKELYVKWKDTAIIVDNNYLKSFYIYHKNEKHTFCRYPALGTTELAELLSADTAQAKLKFVKLRNTKLQRNDKSSAGSNYLGDFADKYVNEYTYYLVFADDTAVKVKLNSKSFLESLKPVYTAKAQELLKSVKKINESSLKQVVDILNKESAI